MDDKSCALVKGRTLCPALPHAHPACESRRGKAGNQRPCLQVFVSAVAESRICGMLTLAHIRRFSFFSSKNMWGKLAALVLTITKWLIGGRAAGTPGVGFTCF